jgi:hypothetical protein
MVRSRAIPSIFLEGIFAARVIKHPEGTPKIAEHEENLMKYFQVGTSLWSIIGLLLSMKKNNHNKGNTMSTESYNGWTNYETWRIQLEVIDGMTLEDFGFDLHEVDTDEMADVERLAEAVAELVNEVVTRDVPEGLALDLALSFIDRVDFMEIAEHLIADAR